MGRNFKICKECPNKIFRSGQVYCDQHSNRCRPFHVMCGKHVPKNHSYCSDHECEKCPQKSKFDCTIHFCGDNKCQNNKKEGSKYCNNHTCKICNQKSPCAEHECKKDDCRNVIYPPYLYCQYHSMNDFIQDFKTIEDMNHELDVFYELHKNDNKYYQYYYSDTFYSFEELKLHNQEYTFKKKFENVANKLNKSINQKKDPIEYGLACTGYCSEGYCTCYDLMPSINTMFCKDEEGISDNDEKVYIISEKARVHREWGLYNNDVVYRAWTISKIFIDELGNLWDKTEAQIEKMIAFDLLNNDDEK